MKESHYNMYMKNVETLDTTMEHHCAAASITTKRNLKVDLGKWVQMYRAPFLYLPGAPNSLNPPLVVTLVWGRELLPQEHHMLSSQNYCNYDMAWRQHKS